MTCAPSQVNTGTLINISNSQRWQRFIGRSFGWGWITINQQAYINDILISFGDLTPTLCFNVVASSIKALSLRAATLQCPSPRFSDMPSAYLFEIQPTSSASTGLRKNLSRLAARKSLFILHGQLIQAPSWAILTSKPIHK